MSGSKPHWTPLDIHVFQWKQSKCRYESTTSMHKAHFSMCTRIQAGCKNYMRYIGSLHSGMTLYCIPWQYCTNERYLGEGIQLHSMEIEGSQARWHETEFKIEFLRVNLRRNTNQSSFCAFEVYRSHSTYWSMRQCKSGKGRQDCPA